ncbi:Hypothetical predicted protein [Olea europaea subsp. europaea]|uniref:Uncharacterized protein n=1 Tax=Olea europaea subsp. europaea TaxID=158383 RepID=A0A8S0RBI1_OLEEU|nr:Hypothetical predicted protein [Olea europaea subsp. europaea]
MSEESVHLVTDTGVRQAHITDGDDDFVDPPRRCEVISHQETPRADEGFSGPQHSLNEEQHHGIQGSAGSPTTESASKLPVKRASRLARILRHYGNVIVFGNYKDHVEEADKSAFLGRLISLSTSRADVDYVFMPLLPMNKAHCMLGIACSYESVGNFEKDLDYNESECKQMKVTIDSTLPQQTNGCDIPHQFDAVKCRIDIASLLYKHREPYVKKARQAFKREGIVIE